MGKLLLIGLGGFAGSIVRYWASGYVQQLSRSAEFPYGTLFVNLAGCLLIGAVSQLAETRGLLTPEARNFVFVGLLGGFTTYSTFGNETFNLLRAGDGLPALLNIGAHLGLGLGAVWLGRTAVEVIWR